MSHCCFYLRFTPAPYGERGGFFSLETQFYCDICAVTPLSNVHPSNQCAALSRSDLVTAVYSKSHLTHTHTHTKKKIAIDCSKVTIEVEVCQKFTEEKRVF